jgi:hypothetical protein
LTESFRVFVGWDSRQAEVYEVCRFSLERRASISVEIRPIKLPELRASGLYWRADDPLAATEFTYSRFLTPALAGYSGWALFCDCDFLWLADIAEMVGLRDPAKAVQCVQHDHRPPEAHKMDGKIQSIYPRKNWSSLMLLNCGHPAARALTPEVVNRESGSWLHQMRWAADNLIGSLPASWNWLEGWNDPPAARVPKAIHFTRGGPWYDEWRSVTFADLWNAERAAMLAAGAGCGAACPGVGVDG